MEIARTGVRLEAEGLLSSTAGNISCRVGPNLIAITPTSIPYPEIGPEDVVITDLDRNVVDGKRRPSSELPFHTMLYRSRADIGGVVHTHSPYATALAIMHRPIPAVHYVIAAFGVDEIPLSSWIVLARAGGASRPAGRWCATSADAERRKPRADG